MLFQNNNICVIVFSEDSPAQLDALLRSADIMWPKHPKFNIIFKSSSDKITEGYTKIGSSYNHNMYQDVAFFQDMFGVILYGTEDNFTMFLTDKDIFIRVFEDNILSSLEDKNNISLSLRLRKFNGESRVKWNDKKGEYGNPVNPHGTIFRTNELRWWLADKEFNDASSLCGILIETIKDSTLIYKDHIAICDTPLILTIKNKQNLIDEFLEGKHVDLVPYFYNDFESTVINNDYLLEWKK